MTEKPVRVMQPGFFHSNHSKGGNAVLAQKKCNFAFKCKN